MHEQVETRVERREKVMELDFVEHVKKEYGSSQIIRQYCELLKDYKLNADVTDNVVSFLEVSKASDSDAVQHKICVIDKKVRLLNLRFVCCLTVDRRALLPRSDVVPAIGILSLF